jgi:L-seryl-tRNA(Ser) seleniumtransferase
MKIHTSNYVVEGYTAEVSETELAKLCHDNKIPFAVDLGSGTLTDLTRFNLPQEPTPMDAMKNGADLVTFSGDKLLGGPQSGIIVGTKKCISELKKNPMKRALRCDKLTLSALSAVLKLYRDPDRVAERIPTLRALVRPVEDIQKIANQIMPELKRKVGTFGTVTGMDCESQVGSGALPTRTINSAGLVIKPTVSSGTRLNELAAAFRKLPIPVIGRIQDDKFLLDLRCLEDVVGFNAQLPNLKLPK